MRSSGGTDIAGAIKDSVAILTPNNTKRSDTKFKDSIYLLTDFDNNAGINPVVNAINYANSFDIRTHIGHLFPLSVKSLTVRRAKEINGDPINIIQPKGYVPFDAVIEAILAGGGSYTKLLNAQSQIEWAKLVDYLDNTPADEIYAKGINLPLDVEAHGFAEANKEITTYYHNAKESGKFKVKVDAKGKFIPDLQVVLKNNGKIISGTQTALANDFYEAEFSAPSGQRIDVFIKRTNLADAGLYNVTLTQTTKVPVVTPSPSIKPVPSLSLPALIILMLFLAGLVAGDRLKIRFTQ